MKTFTKVNVKGMPAERGRAKQRAAKRAPVPGFIVYENGMVQSIHCKLCDVAIKEQREDPNWEQTREIRGQIIKYKRLIPHSLSDYREITIQFNDGSAHVTSICAPCLSSLDGGKLERLYQGDLAQWLYEAEIGMGDLDWEYVADREITGYTES